MFAAGLPIVMCGLELANMARIKPAPMVDAIRQTRTPTADMVYRLFEHYRDGDLETGLNSSIPPLWATCCGAELLLHYGGLLRGYRNGLFAGV